jgi:hypothetical protein
VLGVPRERALVFQARTALAASRRARETPCTEIRELLANLRGGSLRRSTLRRHLRECARCREFRDEVKAQRRALALVLPVAPTLALKEAVLAAVFGSGAAGGGGPIAAAGGGALAAKALVAVALVVGGTVAVVEATREATKPDRSTARPAERTPPTTNGPVRPAAPPPVSAATVPVAVVEEERAEARPRRQRTRRPDSRVKQPTGCDRSRSSGRSRAARRSSTRSASSPSARPSASSAPPAPGSASGPQAPRKAKREREPQPTPVATATPVA